MLQVVSEENRRSKAVRELRHRSGYKSGGYQCAPSGHPAAECRAVETAFAVRGAGVNPAFGARLPYLLGIVRLCIRHQGKAPLDDPQQV
ncbi:MAG: hypothetical protein R3E79_32185 [Caldilineaceae bacterium]